MNSTQFLQKAKTSFQTFVALTYQTELTQEVLRLMKEIQAGKEEYHTMCMECQEILCDCDHEAIGDRSKDDEPISFVEALKRSGLTDNKPSCQQHWDEDVCPECDHCITERIPHPAGESTSSIDSERCNEGYFDHP